MPKRQQEIRMYQVWQPQAIMLISFILMSSLLLTNLKATATAAPLPEVSYKQAGAMVGIAISMSKAGQGVMGSNAVLACLFVTTFME